MSHPSPEACATCPAHHVPNLEKLGVDLTGVDYVVALAGNPNTGKSTVFNALTGLRQHTGNWPGKTVTRAEGAFATGDKRFKLVDLPGTYSLLSSSLDEEVARDFILFGQPDVTVIVVDATCLERNLNLVLQVLEITDRAVVCLNLMDEARRRGLVVDPRRLARDLGVRVVPTAARFGEGLPELMQAIAEVAAAGTGGSPRRVGGRSPSLERAVARLTAAEAAAHLAAGQFPAGSMGPKIEAALWFLERGGREVIICHPDDLLAACEGRAGTLLTKEATP